MSAETDSSTPTPDATAGSAGAPDDTAVIIDTDPPGPSTWSPPGYEVLGPLAYGPFTIVHRAREVTSGRMVAMKVAHVEESPDHASGCPLLVHEARLLARFRHPHILTAYAFGEHQGRHYLVTELAEGGDLYSRIADGPLDPRHAARLMEAIARAVHHVNGHGVIYRNLMLSNILLAGDGDPRLTDFSLSLALADEKVERDGGQLWGVPAYIAPEQVNGWHLSPATDVYGLGATLYHAVTSRPPFSDLEWPDFLHRLQTEGPTPPRTLAPGVPADLEAITLRCLVKDPSNRYPTAEAVADELRRFLAGDPVEARPLGALGRAWRWLGGS